MTNNSGNIATRCIYTTIALLGVMCLNAEAAAAASAESPIIPFGDGSQWRSVGGPWEADRDVIVSPIVPKFRDTHSRAFYVAHAYSDATVEFDWPTWAIGCIVEVEPDVLLVTYMSSDRGDVANLGKVEVTPLLAQRIRITADGIEPAP